MTDEWVRRLLRREGLTAQRVRTGKTSHDPAFDRKKLIRALYRRCPPRGAVVCFDEWGPLDLKAIGGTTWARQKQPWRMRATYRRLKGTKQFLGFYDVHADCLRGWFCRGKRVLDSYGGSGSNLFGHPRKLLGSISSKRNSESSNVSPWPIPTTPLMGPDVVASTLISDTDTASSPTYITHSTAPAHLGQSSWNGTRSLRF